MNKLLKNADQIGIIVADLDAFIKAMDEFLGLRGFEIIDYPPPEIDAETTYYEQPSDFKVRMAFRNFDKFQLEVIQPVDGQSVFKDFLEKNGPGLHHIRFTAQEFDRICEDLISVGIQRIASGRGAHGSSKWAYFDTSVKLQGLFIEIRKTI